MSRTDLNDDEFDVELLARKISAVFRRMFRWMFSPLHILKSKPLRLVSFMLAGVIVALVFRYTLPYTYQASFIIKPINRGDLYFVNLFTDIAILVNEKDYQQVAEELHLDEAICRKVKKISMDLVRHPRYKDSAEIAIIYILTTDRNCFDTVQSSLMNYMENSPYYAKIRQFKIADIGEIRMKLTRDIGEMDKLKQVVSQSMLPRDAGGYVFGEPVNPVDVYEEELSLYRQLMTLKWQEGYVNNFELVKKCVPSYKPHFPKMVVLVPLCLALSLLLCYMYNLWKKDYDIPVV